MSFHLNGFYITIPFLSLWMVMNTILLSIILYEMCYKRKQRPKNIQSRRRRNNYKAKLLVVFVALILILTANIGCANDLVHVVFCLLESNTKCANHDDINRMAADIAYFMAYCSFYFLILTRLYITFVNTRYRLSACTIFILFVLTACCYVSCAMIMVLGYYNKDNMDDFDFLDDFSLISFMLFDFTLNVMVLVLFIQKMNKVIVNKTYRVDGKDLDDGTGAHKTIEQTNTNTEHDYGYDAVTASAKDISVDANEYDTVTQVSWSVMDNRQVTLTTIVTRLALLTLMAILFNMLYAVFLVYYYLYTYLTGDDSDSSGYRRDFGISYCARSVIATLDSLLMLLNFNFCHRQYYRCCKCCHKSLFRCFVRRNSKYIKGLSMRIGVNTLGGYVSVDTPDHDNRKLSGNSLAGSTTVSTAAEFEYAYYSDN